MSTFPGLRSAAGPTVAPASETPVRREARAVEGLPKVSNVYAAEQYRVLGHVVHGEINNGDGLRIGASATTSDPVVRGCNPVSGKRTTSPAEVATFIGTAAVLRSPR